MEFFTLFDDIKPQEDAAPAPSKKKELTCSDCKLCDSCHTPKMEVRGKGEKRVLIVTDRVYKVEDTNGFLGHSPSLIFLKTTLRDIGINLYKDAWVTAATICYGKKIPPVAMEACRKNLLHTIDELQPRAIILLGASPFHSIISPKLTGRINGAAYSDFYGEMIPDQDMRVVLCPTYDASYMLETRSYGEGGDSPPLYIRDPSMYKMWKDHLQAAFNSAANPVSVIYYTKDCHITQDESQAIDWIKQAMDWYGISFDFETNSLRPYRTGAEIIAISISNGKKSYAFPYFSSERFHNVFKRLMLSAVPKISHNLPMEAVWTKKIFGVWVKNWQDDTLLAQHCLHNQKPVNLKFCVYSNFGVVGYDKSVEKYIRPTEAESDKHGENGFNALKNAPIEEVLLYNALDSLFTYRLRDILRDKMDEFVTDGYEFLVESATTLSKMSYNGIRVNENAFTEAEILLKEQLEKVRAEFYTQPEIKKWDGDEPISMTSTQQLSHLTYDILKVKPLKYTDKGTPSMDKEAIEKLGLHFLNIVAKYRELDKMRSTVIEGWKREAVDGYVHPNFNLGTTETFRSSSTSPNAQNNYKRDPEKKRIARSLVIPRKGNKLIEYDFKQLEVIINACHSQDAGLIRYLKDPSADMHLDSTMDCFLLDAKEAKPHRGAVKALFVFSEFYGNWYGKVAKDLWEYAHNNDLIEHLASKGIKTYAKFEDHIKKAEDILWGKRFPGHRAWMKEQYATYLKQGYLETYTGFRPRGPMKRNVAYNIKIQGDGFHVLLWAINKAQEKIETLERSFIINEIHDSLIVDCHPSEEAMIDHWVYKYFTQEVKEHWPWITLDLNVDKEVSAVDGSWDKMESCGLLRED